MNKNFAELSRIAFSARSQTRFFDLALLRSIKNRFGSEIHLYCYGPQEVIFYRKHGDGLFASITDANVLAKSCTETSLDEEQVFERARLIEDKIGITINRMIVPHRHFGRGYCLGGYYHPRSRQSENTTYVQVVHAFCETLSFWEREFSEKRITVCLNAGNEAARIARILDIPYRVMIGSRVGNLHCWAWNELYENPEFERRWNEISDVGDVDLITPYFGHVKSRKIFQSRFGLKATLKQMFLVLARFAYWKLRRYEKGKNYYVADSVRHQFRIWRQYRRYQKIATTKLSDLKGKRFVFFPLHVEPETALHGISPEYFYQHSMIAAVSRDLPAGIYLAVKEAYGSIGRRPNTFYRQINDLKNVVLLDCWEQGIECAREADAVVTICGTVGLEAVVAGTPVIAFGHHNLYNFLPSVRVVHDERLLASYLYKALFASDVKKRTRNEGRRLLRAIIDCSFDMGNYHYNDIENFNLATIEFAGQALAKSLQQIGIDVEQGREVG